MNQNIFAYTPATGEGYPPYLSINRLPDGDVEITVRSPPNQILHGAFREGTIACMRLPAEQLQQLSDAAREHL